MKKIAFFIFATLFLGLARATPIRLPQATELKEALDNAGYRHFAETSDIIRELLEQNELHVMEIVVLVTNALNAYTQYMVIDYSEPTLINNHMNRLQENICQILLKNDPIALRILPTMIDQLREIWDDVWNIPNNNRARAQSKWSFSDSENSSDFDSDSFDS